MNKIALSVALTAALGFVGLKLAGSRIGELYTGTMPSVRLVETAPRNAYLKDWRSVVAGEETGLAKPDADRVADPIGAFKRWA